MNPVEKRRQRIAEGLLENEALTTNLDDAAAKILLNWGLELAEKIALRTAGMDDRRAEETMYRPMRSLRRMLRSANKLAANPNIGQLTKFFERAADTYGKRFSTPKGPAEAERFLTRMPQEQVERILWLRTLIETEK